MMAAYESNLIARADAFAAIAHQGQRRDHGPAYIEHPRAVAALLRDLLEHPGEELLAAALLHDVLEDSEATEAELAERFGTRVARLVAAVSMPKGIDKAAFLAGLAQAEDDAVRLKLADRICNLRDLRHLGDPLRIARAMEQTRAHLVPLAERVEPLFRTALESALAELEMMCG